MRITRNTQPWHHKTHYCCLTDLTWLGKTTKQHKLSHYHYAPTNVSRVLGTSGRPACLECSGTPIMITMVLHIVIILGVRTNSCAQCRPHHDDWLTWPIVTSARLRGCSLLVMSCILASSGNQNTYLEVRRLERPSCWISSRRSLCTAR